MSAVAEATLPRVVRTTMGDTLPPGEREARAPVAPPPGLRESRALVALPPPPGTGLLLGARATAASSSASPWVRETYSSEDESQDVNML